MTFIYGKGNYVLLGPDPAGHGLPAGAYDQAYVWKSMNFLSNELNYSQTHAYPELHVIRTGPGASTNPIM